MLRCSRACRRRRQSARLGAASTRGGGARPVPDLPRDPDDAAEFVKTAMTDKPELIVHGGDLPATAFALRDVFAASGHLFDRDMPVKLVQPADGGPMSAKPLTPNSVVM